MDDRLTFSEVKKLLYDLGASKYQLDKPEVRELVSVLFPGEQPRAFIFGVYDAGSGLVVATDQRLLLVDKRFFGLRVEDIPYSTINSVEYDLGVFFGTVKLFCRAEVFIFRWVRKPSVRQFADFVDQQMLRYQRKDDVLEKDIKSLR